MRLLGNYRLYSEMYYRPTVNNVVGSQSQYGRNYLIVGAEDCVGCCFIAVA